MAAHLVTGGAGFIGSSLVERLLASGETVRVLDDFSTGRRQNLERLQGRIELIEASVCDADAVTAAMRDVEVVFHEAAIPSVARSVTNPSASLLANVQGTTVVLEAARHAGVRRLIYAASSSAYGDTPTLPKVETMPATPLSPYAVSKLAGELLLRVYAQLHGIETLSLRYFNVFGPRQNPASQYAAVIPSFVTAALEHRRPIVFGDGEQTRDFCYVENVVAANLLAAGSTRRLGGEVLNVACGERTSLNELLRIIGEETGARFEPDFQAPRLGEVRDSLADLTAVRALLGYEPRVKLREGIRRTIAWIREVSRSDAAVGED